VPPDPPDPCADELFDDPAGDPDGDELSIDLMNDSFFLEGVGRIMAEARARGATGCPDREGAP
jgi:hypothetical protein